LAGTRSCDPARRGTAAEQLANLHRAVTGLRPLLAQTEGLVITHGNGPQVGNELLRQESAQRRKPTAATVARSRADPGEIGALIAAELRPALEDRDVACLLTHVTVAPGDSAFDRPTKPIGPFYSAEQAKLLERERGWALVSDANRGHRRVVPSPEPLEIVELDAIRRLVEAGTVTIACGGGGIPVARRAARLSGVDAVIDKDRASALLARELGAERLIILTEVPAVYRSFGDGDQDEIRELSRDEAEALLPQLPEGSMRPKIESALGFAGETLITSFDALRHSRHRRHAGPAVGSRR
jgi:carbamate kinase